MATKQDFLDLEGSRVELGEIIVSTLHGDVIAARIMGANAIELTKQGAELALQMDGEAAPVDVKRRKRAPAVVPVPEPDPAVVPPIVV